MRMVAAYLLLLLAGTRSADFEGEIPESIAEEFWPPGIGEEEEIDINGAPLAILSRVGGVGRRGAATLGKLRLTRRISSAGDLPEGILHLIKADGRTIQFASDFRAKRPTAYVERRAIWKKSGRSDITRIAFGRREWKVSALAERDGGEASATDLLVWSVERRGRFVNAVGGDLSVRLGSGLLVGTAEPFGPPSSVTRLRRSRLGRFQSRAESAAHRGVGLEFLVAGCSVEVLATHTYRDARVDDQGRVSSIDDTGTHRSGVEIDHKDALLEKIGALRIEKGDESRSVAVTVVGASFSPELGGGDRERKPNRFQGGSMRSLSIDGEAGGSRTMLQGEAGLSGGGIAARTACRYRGASWAICGRARFFSSRFHAPRSAVYHRLRSVPAGERGSMLLMEKRFSWGGAFCRYHRFSSMGRTYRSDGGVRGDEGTIRCTARRESWKLAGGLSFERRVETRSERELAAGRISLSTSAEHPLGDGWRIRFDAKRSETLDPGSPALRQAIGWSLLLRGKRVSLSYTHMGADDAVLAFVSPSTPGSAPVTWVGRGRGRGGLAASIRGGLAGRYSVAVAAGPGSVDAVLAFGGRSR